MSHEHQTTGPGLAEMQAVVRIHGRIKNVETFNFVSELA